MITTRLLYVFLIFLSGGVAYASMRMPSRMDDANFVGIVGALGAIWGIVKLGESFTQRSNHNHS